MKKIILAICALTMITIIGSAEPKKKKIDKDPFYESFYEKTRLIMSKEEIEIYKHLPDNNAKQEFIKEFWKKRDPNPETEENEVKAEFEERIAYANKWFNEHKANDRGWDTARGRILLQIGFPEERHWGEMPDVGMGGRLRTTQRQPMEVWIYLRYQMRLIFRGDRHGFGSFRLASVPAQLRTVLDQAKRRMDLGSKKAIKNTFKFDADYKDGSILVQIPTKRISFEKTDAGMGTTFRVQVFVYKDYEKITEIHEIKTVSQEKDDLLNKKDVEFSIPYTPEKKGKYYFDLVVTEESSSAKYRYFFKYKKK